MGVPTSEVGYTSAMPRREDHEVRKGHVDITRYTQGHLSGSSLHHFPCHLTPHNLTFVATLGEEKTKYESPA